MAGLLYFLPDRLSFDSRSPELPAGLVDVIGDASLTWTTVRNGPQRKDGVLLTAVPGPAGEEARCLLDDTRPGGFLQLPVLAQLRLHEPVFAPGPESLEVKLFAWDEIPWDDIAFPTVRWALHHAVEIGARTDFAARTNPPDQTATG
jgi:hypothetical protein